jgi:nitrogen fixation protein NifX
MRVAFATMDQEKVDIHFGISPGFAIYDITPDHSQYIGMIHFPKQFVEEDKVEGRAEVLKGCTVVYCTQIGGPAQQDWSSGIFTPLKSARGRQFKKKSRASKRC